MLAHRLKHAEGAHHVVVIIHEGVAHRLRDDNTSAHVHHSVGLVGRKNAVEERLVTHVALLKGRLGIDRGHLPVGSRQIVSDNDAVLCRSDQLANKVGANVAGAAENKNLHGLKRRRVNKRLIFNDK